MKRCLITGVSGMLGSNLAYSFKHQVDILGLYYTNPVFIDGCFTEKCDLRDSEHVKIVIAEYDPQIVIHCASLTDIDQCETDKGYTREINVLGTKHIVQAVLDKEIKLIYLSTDAVYDGLNGNFSETDRINPKNYYGLSKYEGELEVLKKDNSLVFRTNIFGWNILEKKSLGEWVLGALTDGKSIQGFKDAFFSSIYTMDIARIISISLKKDIAGVFNCGSISPCSKHEFSLKIADIFGLDKTLVESISLDDFGFRAKRGKKLTLNVEKLQKALDYKLPTLDYCIDSFYRDYKSGLPEEIKKTQAENGQKTKRISYGRQWIDERDIRAVVEVLRSGPITQGPKVEDFENALKSYCGATYAVAANSGTSGLHMACLAVGIANNNEVITSPITFVASANCAVYCGAKPVFADIDPKTYNVAPEEIEKSITPKTKAIIPVHFAGQSCDMESLSLIVKNKEKRYGHKIYIIEDASHGLGSEYKNKRVGSCIFSDMVVMSFHPVKHITTGEGGVVLTNDEGLYKKLRRFRSHGITSTPGEFIYNDHALQPAADGKPQQKNQWYYEQINLGYNYRLTDIQCTLGLSQLRKIDQFKRRRREIVNRYNTVFSDIETIQTPFEDTACDSNFHLYVLLFDFNRIGLNRAEFINKLKESGIQTQVHYIPVHTQPFFQKYFNTQWGDCPFAEKYYQKCLSIPLYPAMTDRDIEKVIEEITHHVVESSRY